jgi:enoyl-CoA hydratase/carnithine racemase
LSLSIAALPQVTIAKVDGICRGGGFELMLAMDMAFASEKARFCFPEASVGFLPAGGGTTLLPLTAGKGRALEIMLTGRDFSATEAELYGVVNRTLKDTDTLNTYVQDTAMRMAANNGEAIAAVKATLGKTFAGLKSGVMAGFAQENSSMVACISDPKVFKSLQLLAEKSGTYDSEIDLPKTISGLR